MCALPSEKKRLKTNLASVVALFFLFSLSLSLVSCGAPQKDVQHGIEIAAPSVYTYKEETLEYAKDAVYAVLYAKELQNGASPSASALEKIEEKAKSLVALTANGGISEQRYLSAARALYAQAETLARVLSGERPISEIKALYGTLSDLIGKEYIGGCVYELLLQGFESKRQAALKSYDASGAAAHLVIAQRQEKNISALKNSVGKENVCRLLDYAFLFSELALGSSFDAGAVALSDAEILMLLTYLNPAALTVGEEGWELIFNLSSEAVLLTDAPSFLQKMQFAAAKNGDGAELSKKMDALLSLLCTSQNRLDTASVALIREGRLFEFFAKLVSKFTAEDFALLDEALSISYENLEYSTLAQSYYGASYTAYLSDLQTYRLDNLIQAVGTDAFENILKGYIAGKCPALSYAIFEADD